MSDTTPQNLTDLVAPVTRGVLASSEIMFAQCPDIALFEIGQGGKLQAKSIQKYGQIPMIFYEVSVPATGIGSWWLPTCTVPDTPSGTEIWGTWGELLVDEDSTIVSVSMLRPQNAWCWVPAGIIEETLSPIEFIGQIKGQHPTLTPQ